MTDGLVVADEAPADWNERTVARPGGHVYQSRAWAEHRRRSGWRPLYVSSADAAVLALTRPWPLVGGSSAYLPRGPVPLAEAASTARFLVAATRALAARGTDVVAADPEVPATEGEYATLIRRAGFRPIAEIQPSRHRIALPLESGADEAAVFGGLSKSTRQRVRRAEPETVVVLHDSRADGGPGAGFSLPSEAPDAALDRFYDLLLETGERRQFTFGSRAEFVGWWRAALAAGLLVYLEARTIDAAAEPIAGLILYRHGGRLSTVHSADRASFRRDRPGTLHLLRWRAIQLALREGCGELDLGGVDVAGARREPREGEPMYGLYQHKLSFGARWVELAGAHERIVRPNRYRLGRLLARARRLTGRRAASG